jgi:hypothetical protein
MSVLVDGKWHTAEEIRDKTELDDHQIQKVIEFLERYCFVSLDKPAKKIAIKENCQEFFRSEF